MLELPDLSKPFFYENNFNLSSDINRLAKIIAHYELFKLTIDIPGAIVECGVFKGSSLIRFTTLRQLLCNPLSKKVIGFDSFGKFPETDYNDDKKAREKFITDSGKEGISEEQLMKVLRHKGIEKNVELIKGGIIVLDDYCSIFPGANKAVEEYFKGKMYEIRRLPFSVTPCYIIKKEI